MKTRLVWKQKMFFEGKAESNVIPIDAKLPIGQSLGLTPKELVCLAIAACTGMDIVGLMRKYKENLITLEVETEVTLKETYPTIFETLKLIYFAKGNVNKERLLEAVNLSQTKYCAISAMLSKAVPIRYDVVLNNVTIGSGQADFT